MEKEFVPYAPSLRMKALGFDEPCFGYYDGNHNFNYMFEGKPENFSYRKFPLGHSVGWTSAPTFSQAFRWFREKYGLYDTISKNGYMIEGELNKEFLRITKLSLKSHEEAELHCLKKLIEIVEQK